ncbi:hypothetical protein GCM10007383_09540 [Arenibacter certesii]|uniref:Uncharacterized protein n=1 Tax=Arenibacter certesii TaxID=228955 RepID=A0A918IQE8_9FLAO|nr:hypothetical protein GCM10007383_09540 [Arenibacter certesii]
MIKPEFDEKFRLVRLGSKTLPNAMAIPKRSVPKYRGNIPCKDLIPIPMAIKSRAPNNVRAMPKRLVNKGVREEKIPKAIKGRVVSNPNIELESPVDTLI